MEVVSKKGFYNGCEVGSLEYLQRQAKLVQKFGQKAQIVEASKEEKETQAEAKKGEGNVAISAKDYLTAVQCYTRAIEISPNGPNTHVYYSNRAAAYCYLNQHDLSVEDCESAISLKKDYTKAYSRLGLSNFHLGRYEEAVLAYEKLVELEPTNKSHQEELRKAKKKLEKSSAPSSSSSSTAPDLSAMAGLMGGGGGGNAGLDAILKNPKMKNAFDKMGGMEGLSSLMKDPSMMAMAQNMMKNPAMMQQAMSMMGGGGGDLPDLSSLAGDLGDNSSSSKKGGKKPFTGFDDA